ncbi:hypothetical protein E3N88_00097 [Mikania micrantha]|uniref:Retrotransposon Copia-like N-terminal domain-containing protein n=1 Tax=Mikania micrantha TaxID=192012 RepID=A0A5N6PZ48_9ASTR|nr:hypothetical protein E3N88_00097 [Mikania micrantha]
MVSEQGSANSTPEITPPPSPTITPHSSANISSAMDTNFAAHTHLKDMTIVSFPTTLKLTSTTYLGWKTQVEALLQDYQNCIQQDRLLFGALIGSLSPQMVSLVTNDPCSHDAWKILANTCAPPSHGHIKQLQYRLKQITKTPNQTITEYMQSIKVVVDELEILGKNLDQENIIDIIIKGLDQSAYKSIVDVVYARDYPISFNELHEKLIN